MRLPMMARSRRSLVALMAASALVGGCSNDATAPAPQVTTATQSATSSFVPTASAKALIGVADGTYEFMVTPKHDQVLLLGANMLYLPANSVCDLASSSYGASHWDEPCAPQKQAVKVTAVVRNAATSHPSIDFYPAMRFNPKTNVSIYFYVPNKADQDKALWLVKYCNDAKLCVDESLADPSLQTYFDAKSSIVFRRIKHFSGYLVNYAADEAAALLPL